MWLPLWLPRTGLVQVLSWVEPFNCHFLPWAVCFASLDIKFFFENSEYQHPCIWGDGKCFVWSLLFWVWSVDIGALWFPLILLSKKKITKFHKDSMMSSWSKNDNAIRFQFWLHLAIYLTCLCFTYFICKTGEILVASHRCVAKIGNVKHRI